MRRGREKEQRDGPREGEEGDGERGRRCERERKAGARESERRSGVAVTNHCLLLLGWPIVNY